MTGRPKLSKAEWFKRAQARFWAKVDVGEDYECWNWGAHAHNETGYGRFGWYNGKVIGAHRAAWMITHRERIPNGMVIRHLCGNGKCCNPAHLELGTRTDNTQDAREGGTLAVGERVGTSKLVAEDVIEIRRLHANKLMKSKDICTTFSISQTQLGRIIKRKCWRHI